MIDQAFVLAAGFGVRLRPLTEVRPKPLLPVANQPLLGLLLDHLAGLGLRRIGLNVHHLADQMAAFAESRPAGPELVLYREEGFIRGTGGGLGQAREAFGGRSLLVVNGDVAFDFDLAEIVEAHLKSRAAVSMVLHDRPDLNQVLVQGERIVGWRQDRAAGRGVRRLAYACVQVVEPVVFDFLPRDSAGDLIEAYRRLAAAGHLIRAHVLAGGRYWTDIGRLEDYLELNRQVLIHGRAIFGRRFQGPVCLAPGAELAPGATTRGFLSLEAGARVAPGAELEDAVVLAGARVEAGASVRRAVLGPGLVLKGRVQDRAVVAGGEP